MSGHAHDTTRPDHHGPVAFGPAAMEEFREILARYPERRAALMGTLWLAQREFGWISATVEAYVATLLDLPRSWVEGVVSFYTMYWRRPMGRTHVAVCTNLSCWLRGAEDVYEAVCRRTGARAGEVSADGRWSVERAECLGSCGSAPMIQLDNDRYVEDLTAESVVALLDRIERGEEH